MFLGAEKAGYQGSMAEIASCSYEARKVTKLIARKFTGSI